MRDESYWDFINEAIDDIEAHLDDELSVQSICKKFPFSSWQFQRIFRIYIGDTLGRYLRIRRLTEAAKKILNDPKLRILDIAIEFQFGSQEAFTRAFKSHFGVTPGEIGETRELYRLKRKARVTPEKILFIQQKINRKEKLLDCGVRYFIGIEQKIMSPLDESFDYVQIVPKLWLEFNSRRKEILNRFKGVGYGIAISENMDMLEESMQYLACVEVTKIDSVPKGMIAFTMPPQLSAAFEKQGQANSSYASIDYIYGVWLQNSGHKRGSGFDYEVYDYRFRLDDENAVSTYCVPIVLGT